MQLPTLTLLLATAPSPAVYQVVAAVTIPAMFLQTCLNEWTPKGVLTPLASLMNQLSALVMEFPVCPFC